MAKQQMSAILSGEPLPIPPPSKDPEQDKYNRDVINYLRRMVGLFTDDNLPSAGASTVDDLNLYIISSEVNLASGRWVLCEAAPFAFNIDTITHRAGANQSTLFDLFVAGSARVGTGDDSPSTTQGVFTPTNGAVAVGESVEVDISIGAPNGAFAIIFTCKRTRT